MNRPLMTGVAAVLLAACSTPGTEELGVLDVGPPPPPLQQAVLAEIDGKRVKTGLSWNRFVLHAGTHSLVFVDPATGFPPDDERAELPRFSIHVEAGQVYFLALEPRAGDQATPVIWQVEKLEPAAIAGP